MVDFAHAKQDKLYEAIRGPISAQKMLKLDCEQLHILHHRAVLDHEH